MFEFDYCKQFGESWQRQRYRFDVEFYQLILLGSEIPKWFNHQSVGNYISFWIHRYSPKLFCCVVFKPESNEMSYIDLQVSLKLNGIQLSVSSPKEIECPKYMTCNHIRFFMVSPDLCIINLFERNLVEIEFECKSFQGVAHILRCGVHVECICPLVQDLSTDTLPPTSIPAFRICSISNTVTPSPHLLNSCLELSNLNSVETTYTDSDTPMGRNYPPHLYLKSLYTSPMGRNYPPHLYLKSLCTSPMGRNYPPHQPQATVPDDASHISLPSTIDLPNNMTDMFESRLGLPGLGIGSTVSEGFHLGSSSMAHNYLSDFNLCPPSKKMRKS